MLTGEGPCSFSSARRRLRLGIDLSRASDTERQTDPGRTDRCTRDFDSGYIVASSCRMRGRVGWDHIIVGPGDLGP